MSRGPSGSGGAPLTRAARPQRQRRTHTKRTQLLPQPAVYGREQRLKVARDEAAAAAVEAAEAEAAAKAEAEFRRARLLERARKRRAREGEGGEGGSGGEGGEATGRGASRWGDAGASGSRPAAVEDEGDEEQQEEHAAAAPERKRQRREARRQQKQQQEAAAMAAAAAAEAAAAEAAGGDGAPLEHINFWREEESKAAHPDKEKERKAELKRRGDPKTQTSDARFDESFKFGTTLGGPAVSALAGWGSSSLATRGCVERLQQLTLKAAAPAGLARQPPTCA